ncbi:MAG: hypothetical protein WAL29_06285 [Bacteroidales bacterium]
MKTLIVICLLLWQITDSYGQWYTRKYDVSDINFLTETQLQESMKDTKSGVYVSLAVAGLGGVVILLENLMPYTLEDEEDPTFFEQLLGTRGMHTVIIGTGIGLAGAGTIACFGCLGRLGTIRSALNRNFPSSGSLNLFPSIVFENYTHSICPGLTLSYRF